jgi:hypothetical protein
MRRLTARLARVDSMVLDETVLSALEAWSLPEALVLERIDGGIDSQTWRVEAGGERFVAKLAWNTTAFVAGLEIAEYLDHSGLRAGRPVSPAMQGPAGRRCGER